MPTVPLYDALAHPNAWHHVTAPGGYEWWRFDAQDASGLRLLLDIFDGDAFSNAYRRAYTRYRRRPTRAKPPVPPDYPCLRFVVMAKQGEQTRQLARAEMSYPPGAFHACADGSEINLGPHSMQRDSNGVIRLAVSGDVSMELTFRPVDVFQPELRRIDSQQRSTTHFQVVNLPEYSVSGTVRGLQGEKGQAVSSLQGSGRHEHFYGTGPLDKAMQQFIVQHLPPAESSVRR